MRALALALTLTACAAPRSEEETTLADVFAALKTGDREAFRRRTITPADLLLAAQGVKGLKKSQTYAGSVLRAEERAALDAAFDEARRGGAGRIPFGELELVGLGTVLRTGAFDYLGELSIPTREVSLKVRRGDRALDTRDLDPTFVLTPHGSFVKVLGLGFSRTPPAPEPEADDEPDE